MNFVSRKTIVNKLLKSKKFRDAYVDENIKRIIPFNLRTMRDERDWSQAEAGRALGKPQNVVSRLESPAYGKLTLQTLLEIAHGYDVGLLIKFVPFSRLVKEYDDVSAQALSAKSILDKEESRALEEWAEHDEEVITDTTTGTNVIRMVDRGRVEPGNLNRLIASPGEVSGQLKFGFKAINVVSNLKIETEQKANITTTRQQPASLMMTESTNKKTATA